MLYLLAATEEIRRPNSPLTCFLRSQFPLLADLSADFERQMRGAETLPRDATLDDLFALIPRAAVLDTFRLSRRFQGETTRAWLRQMVTLPWTSCGPPCHGARSTGGRIRLIIAADEIPEELERSVRYVNARLRAGPFLELLQLQYRQDGDVQILLAGAPAPAPPSAESPGAKPETTEKRLFDALRARSAAPGYAAVRRIYDWSSEHGMSPLWGRRGYPSVIASFAGRGISLNPWELSASSRPNPALNLGYLAKKRVPREWVEEFARDLEGIPGLVELVARSRDTAYQQFPLLPIDGILARDGVAGAIIAAVDRLIAHLGRHEGPGEDAAGETV